MVTGEQEVDVFDLLPDALVYEIFNRVADAKSLSACAVVCKRFGDLVSQTHNVSLEITRRPESSKTRDTKGFIGRFVWKPIHAFVQRLFSKKCKSCCEEDEEDSMFRLPNDLLNNFREIRRLRVKLPGHEGEVSSENASGALLKWKAEFGERLESCVILGATGFQKLKVKPEEKEISPRSGANLTSKQLKKRVVWTISCLIASSARHHMLKQIISRNRNIRDVKISDGSKQGTIEMTEKQVVELRESTAEVAERTKVPAVTIKMWYMPVLELPESGGVMRGATLAVIRPTETTTTVEKGDDVGLAIGAFEESFMAEGVRKLIDMKKSYTLEMNSF